MINRRRPPPVLPVPDAPDDRPLDRRRRLLAVRYDTSGSPPGRGGPTGRLGARRGFRSSAAVVNGRAIDGIDVRRGVLCLRIWRGELRKRFVVVMKKSLHLSVEGRFFCGQYSP